MTRRYPAWSPSIEFAPSQDGWLHPPLSLPPEPAEAALQFSFAIAPSPLAIEFLPEPLPSFVHGQKDSARHELNLAALLVCLSVEEAALAGPGSAFRQQPSPYAEAAAPQAEIPAVWDDEWMKFLLAGSGGEPAWHIL